MKKSDSSFTTNTVISDHDLGVNSSSSTDQERKILLLMLLAQVCALHDSTPKTFIVHVLSLYERGIIDYENIAFLFDLGLVPSIVRTAAIVASDTVANTAQPLQSVVQCPIDTVLSADSIDTGISKEGAIIPYYLNTYTTDNTRILPVSKRNTTTSNLVTTTSTIHTHPTIPSRADSFTQTLQDHTDEEDILVQQRLKEVSLIREHLSRQESQSSQKSSLAAPPKVNTTKPQSDTPPPLFIPSWSVDHHPLFFSRYVRDFHPQSILASGAFGQVFRATNKLDGVDYAIKKVVFSAKGYDTQQVDVVIREVQCLAKLDHPNVVRYYTSWLEPSWMHGSRSTSSINNTTTILNDEPSSYMDHGTKMNNLDDTDGIYSQPHALYRPDEIPKKELERKLIMDVHRLILTREDERETRNDIFNRISIQLGNKKIKYEPQQSDRSWEESDDDDDDDDTNCSEWTNQSHSHDENDHTRHELTRKQDDDLNPRSYKYQICLFIQMQLCHSSTLADWILQRNQSMTSLRLDSTNYIDYHQHARPAFEIFRQILKGLVHIHARGIIHRDLKPANVFASEDGVFKIGDFGLSKLLNIFDNPRGSCDEEVMDDTRRKVLLLPSNTIDSDSSAMSIDKGIVVNVWNDLHTAGVGTASYAAPEQIRSRSYGPEADIFSLGLILLELFSFFSSEHERAVTFHDCRRGKLPSWMTWTYPEVSKLVLACTNQDPSLRPSASNIISMEIFQESSSAEIYKAEIQSLRHELEKKEAEVEKLNQIIQQQEELILRLEKERI